MIAFLLYLLHTLEQTTVLVELPFPVNLTRAFRLLSIWLPSDSSIQLHISILCIARWGQEGRQCSTKQVTERLKNERTVCQLLCGHAYAIAFIYAPDSKPTKKNIISDLRLWEISTNTHKQQQFCGSLWLRFREMLQKCKYAKYVTYIVLYTLSKKYYNLDSDNVFILLVRQEKSWTRFLM